MEHISRTQGKDLRVGDTIEVWWKPGMDTIASISLPEAGSIAHNIFPEGFAYAKFLSGVSMTISYREFYDIYLKKQIIKDNEIESERITRIVNVLMKNEEFLSDGFEFYLGTGYVEPEEVPMTLRPIAKIILDSLKE